MPGELGLPSKPLRFFGEQWKLEERTTDPSTTSKGEAWLRTDLDDTAPLSTADQLATLRFDAGTEVWDIPIFQTGTSENGVQEVLRIPISGTTGYIPVFNTDPAFPQLGFQHNSTRHALHNWYAPEAIPNSVIHHYDPTNFTSSSWPDDVGTSDIDTVSGPTADGTAFGNEGGVTGDGTSDYAQSDTMGSFGSDMNSDFALSVPLETTDNDVIALGEGNTGDSTQFYIAIGTPFGEEWGAGTLVVTLTDSNADRITVHTSSSFNDGSSHHFLINKTGNSASGVDLYVDNMTTPATKTTAQDGAFDTPTNYDVAMTYFAQNARGTVEDHAAVTFGNIRWFNDSLTQTEREAVDGALPWS